MTAQAAPSLPGPLRPTPSAPFVGRADELAVLDRLWADARREGCRLAMIQGEPGSGKTRLAREAAQRAAATGAGVLYGACHDSLSSPYQPFVEILEHLEHEAPAILTAAAERGHAGDLARLLPGLGAGAGAGPPRTGADTGAGRHRLHVAVTDVLAAYAGPAPAVLVLDDLHWADAPTLLLLRHLARVGAGLGLLIVATARDVEAEAAPDLADALADLRRLDSVMRVRMGGLRPAEIGELLRRITPRTAPSGLPRLCQALAELTRGNAFLVAEFVQHLADAGALETDVAGAAIADAVDEVGIPQGVRELVGQRLARLSPRAREVVEACAVAGRAVNLATAAAVTAADDDELLAALDEAVASHVLEEVPGARIAYRFRHELLRRAVSDRLSQGRRAALHLRIGQALETIRGAADDRTVNDLAFHFHAAAGLRGADRAIHYGLRAAAVAMRSFAYGDAAARLQATLDLGIEDAVTRGHALRELGTALHRAGRVPQALESFAAAAVIARDTGNTELLADAAIGFETACWRPGIEDIRAVELLAEAESAAGPADGPLRVRILASLSRALAYRGEHDAAIARWRSAVAMARRVGDSRSLAVTLFHAAWMRGSQPPDAVLASLDEARDLFVQMGGDDLRHEIDGFRLSLVLESYNTDVLRRELAAFGEEVERVGQPFYLHVHAYVSATLAVCDGDFDHAERMASRALELSRQFDKDASVIHGIQMFTLLRERGRLGPAAPLMATIIGRDSRHGPAWAPALAVMLAEIGMLDEARAELARLAADDFSGVPRGGLWLAGLTYLADACALVEDAAVAAPLYAELRDLEGKNVVIGQGVACYGAADRYLGTLAALLGDRAAAERHFTAALHLNEKLRSPTWVAHTRYEHARALLRWGGEGDAEHARQLLDRAAAVAQRIGMSALAARVDALRRPAPTPGLPDDLTAREAEVLALVAGGLSNRKIAHALTISPHTAANHVRSILIKTGCANRTEAASYAHRNRLLRRETQRHYAR